MKKMVRSLESTDIELAFNRAYTVKGFHRNGETFYRRAGGLNFNTLVFHLKNINYKIALSFMNNIN